MNFTNSLSDSQQTIPRSSHAYGQTQPRHDKPEMILVEDAAPARSVVGERKSSVTKTTDNYYLYWKNKANEYLETNIQLADEVRKLTSDNETLKKTIERLTQERKLTTSKSE